MSQNNNLIHLKDHHNKSFFRGAGREDLLNELVSTARRSTQSLCVISGPEGIGKTTLLNAARQELHPAMHIIVLQGHFGTLRDMLDSMASQLDVELCSDATEQQFLGDISRALSLRSDGKPVAILFDDAHALPLPVIRRLIGFFADRVLETRILLFIDNEAVDVICSFLRKQDIRSLPMRRIGRSELAEYLQHGAQQTVHFDAVELDAIFKASDGVPERINQQAGYILKQRTLAPQPSVAPQREEVATLSWATHFSRHVVGYAAAASFCLVAAVLTIGNNSASPLGGADALANAALLEESIAAIDEEFEVELPEEFVEFSSQLSDDEIDLLQIDSDQYVLQFMAGDSEEDIEAFVDEHEELGVKVYRSLIDGSPWYKAVATGFSKYEDATRLIKLLPKELRKEKPWVRSVASVQEEILTMGEIHLFERASDIVNAENWLVTVYPADLYPLGS